MLTTATLSGVFITAFVFFIVANFLFWIIEVVAATVRSVCCWFLKKPNDWQASFHQVRVILTRILLRVSFAFVPPKEAFQVTNQSKSVSTRHKDRLKKMRTYWSKKRSEKK